MPLWVTTHDLSLQSQPITILLWFPQRPAGGALLNTSHSPLGSLWETAGERAWARELLTDGLRGGLCTAGALVLWQSKSQVSNYMFSILCKHLFLLFHNYPFFCFVIATPFLIDFTHHRSTGTISISIFPPALPALQQWPCASWVRTHILLMPCSSWIQITKIKSSAGSICSQSVYVFICSSNLRGLHQS